MYGLDVSAANGITFTGNIGHTKSLAYLTVNHSASLPSVVNTLGHQIYKGSLILASDTQLTASGANSSIYLLSAVDAMTAKSQSLTISAAKTYVIGNIGQNKQINALTINASNIYLFADVHSWNSQTYNGDVWIGDGANVGTAIGSTLAAGINGVSTSFLSTINYNIFNYNYRQWHSYAKYSAASNVRTLVSEDPSITFNGRLNDYNVIPTHTLLLAAISNNWETPTLTFNGAGDSQRLYSINAQTMYRWDTNSSFGNINFNGMTILTETDQTYRTTSMDTQARNYAPISDMPPGKFTVISPNVYNPTNYGISNGAAPGTVKILITAPPTIGNLGTTTSVRTVTTSTGQSTTTNSTTFSGGTSGSTSSAGNNSGNNTGGNTGNNSGGNTGGNTGGGTGGNSGGTTGGNSGGNTGGNSGGNTGGNSGGNTGGNSGGSSGGNSPPPVTVVTNNANPPDRSGSSLGAISLGSIMQGLFGAGSSQKSLPSLGGQKSPLGIAVVDVGAIQADCPTAPVVAKNGEC